MSAAKSDLFIYTGDDLDPVAKKQLQQLKDDKNYLYKIKLAK